MKGFRSNSYTYNIGIDAANPTLEFTIPNRANTAADTDKQVLGVAKDTSGIKSIKGYNVKENSDVGETGDLVHSWEKGADSNTISVTAAETTGYTSVTWEDTIASSILAKGSWRRRYIVEDIYSNTTTLDFIYYVDNVSPEILKVEGISAGGIINGGQIFLVKGTASDKDNTGKDQEISSVRWKVSKADESVSVSGGKYAGADTWEACSIGAVMNSDKSWNWSAAINLADNITYPDGEYVLYLAAFDAAGNQSKAVATAADNKPATQIAFANDKTPPAFGTITITEDLNASNTTTGTALSAKGAVTISGTLTEANLEKLEAKVSGKTTAAPVTVADGKWSYPISAPGNYSVSFTATDKAGNTATTATYTVEIDTEKPTVELDDFADGKWFNSKDFALRVYVNDRKTDSVHTSYIKNVTASILKADGTEEKMLVLSTTSATPGAGKTLYTGSVEGLSEGKKKLKVTAEDNVGNQTVLENITFTVDITSPELMIDEYTSPSNVVQTVTGTVSDTIGTVLLSVTKTETTGDTSTTADPVSIKIGDNGAWSYTLDAPGSTTEKTVKFTFVATDNAGNKTTKTEEVILDGEKPDITVPSKYKAWAKPEANEWRNTGTQTVYVLLPANDLSGIAEVKYSYGTGENAVEGDFLQGSRVSYDSANKTASDSSNGNYRIWSTTIDLPEGFTNIEVTAKDGAGNSQSAQTLIPYHIDTTMPSVVKVEATPANVNASTETVTLSIDVSDKNTNESINVSGLRSWRVKVGSYEKSGDFSDENNIDITEYTVDISAKDAFVGDNSVVQVFVTDNAGNTSPAGTVTVQSDTTRPVVKINKLPDSTSAVKLNKKATISGTISDTGFVDVGSKAPVLEVSSDKNTWNKVTNAAGTFGKLTYDTTAKQTSVVWTAEINTEQFYTAGNASGSLYVRMTAYDEAGNSNTKILYNGAETEFAETSVNQDHDRPVLRFTSMDKFDGSWPTNTGVVAGSIVDDDKADGTVVKGLWYIDAGSYDVAKLPSVGTDNGWTNVDVDDAGNWECTVDASETQGTKTWHFYVIDNADGAFCNTLETANALSCPYFQYKTDESTKTKRKDGITFTVDTVAPTADIAVAQGANNTAPPADSAWKTEDGAVFGPNQGGYLWIRVSVKENVGMPEWAKKPVVLKIGEVDAAAMYVKTEEAGTAPNTTYTYYFAKRLSELTANGTLSVSAEVQDSSGQKATAARRITIDAKTPSASILSPAASIGDKVLGAITIRGMASDENSVSTIKKLEWAIPKKNVADDAQEWKTITGVAASGSYTLDFTNSAENEEGILYYVQSAQTAVYDVVEVTKIADSDEWAVEMKAAGYPLGNYGGCFKVPVWFRVTDAVNNVAITKNFIVVDRDGGKPLVSINTPEEGAVVSGMVTIYGTAIDDIAVKEVQLQIDENNDGNFDATDYGKLATIADIKPLLKGDSTSWYLLADGTSSWKLTVPTDFLITEGEATGTLSIRAQAFDYDGNSRGWSEVRSVTIDSNAPAIENLRVVQYGLNVTAEMNKKYPAVSERAYEAGMYLSDASVKENGQWYLTGEVTDNEGVSRILFDRLTSSTNAGIDLGLKNIPESMSDKLPAGILSYTLNIPLKTDASGQIYYKITANDNTTGTTTQVITINIDSDAPSLYDTAGNRKTSALDNALRLRPNGSTKPEDMLGASTVITNSNTLFTVGDEVVEDGSGLHSVAFWFERKKGAAKTPYLYDPMMKSGTTDSVEIESAKTAGKVYLNSEQLPALYFTGATRGSENTLTLPAGVDMKHIRPRGMIKIAGTYCTIDKNGVSGKTITFTPRISTTFTDGEIILAQVVDNQTVEAQTDGEVDTGSDDGDKMIETIRMAGSTYTWSASFNSTNIPDGPIIVHVTAMDKAGNVTTGSIDTQVANNRPRLAKVLIGTDLNSNGTFDYNSAVSLKTKEGVDAPSSNGKAYGEFSYYSALDSNNKAQEKVTLETGGKMFKVRDGLIIIPEFVGGNGSQLQYAWKDSAQTDPTKAAEASLTPLVKGGSGALQLKNGSNGGMLNNGGEASIMDEIGDFGGIVLTGSTGILGLTGDKTLSITFWDETEETTPGTDSQWALLNIPLNFSTSDGTAPDAKIKPFYWESKSKNSVHSSGSVDSNNLTLLGHIELEDDLPAAFTGSTGAKDRDPKVSGKIVLEGTVYDDWLLGSVSATFGTLISDEPLATYANGVWTKDTPPAGIVSFDISDTEISQDGHTASWKLVLDTEKISTVAAADVSFSVVATDAKGGNASTPGTVSTKTDAETGYYRMDVVPYVTEITTSLSSFYRSAPSAYARTAKGRYPVREGTEITLSGWNLGTNPTVTLNGTTLSRTSGLTYNIGTTAKTGDMTVTVSSVSALNNSNNDSVEYNQQPNNVNNNTLTDGLSFDVWQFKNAAEPVNGGASDVTMKINPKDGTPGFSFANSILYFNMPGYVSNTTDEWRWSAQDGISGNNYSQVPFGMNYGGFVGGTFCYDNYGYSYGASMCTDTETAVSSAYFQFFSRENPIPIGYMDQNMNYWNSANASRLDSSTIQMHSGSSTNSLLYETNINRIQSVAMETTKSTDGSVAPSNTVPTYVYMAYYDAMTKQVRFRWGTIGGETDEIDGASHETQEYSADGRTWNRQGQSYGLDDIRNSKYSGVSQKAKNSPGPRESYVEDSFYKYSNSNNGGIPVQVVAASGVSGSNIRSAYSDSTDHKAGQYVSLSIVGKDTASPIAVVSWYDSVNMELCMAYNTSPTTSKTWVTKVIDSNGGINVKTAVDKDGGIHFAYYDNMNGSDLKYAYLSSYDAATPTVVTVDAFGAVGAKPTIDVVKENGKWVPYIGYQMNAYLGTPIAAKTAHYVGSAAVATAGADSSDFYTGDWEVSVVPTANIPNDDLINIGLWRNSDGTAKKFTSNSDWTTGDIKPNGYISNGTLNVCNPTLMHGNNTTNPILGYGIDTGAIEMAQKK